MNLLLAKRDPLIKFKQFIVLAVSLLLSCTNMLGHIAFAQNLETDFQLPELESNQRTGGVLGADQTFNIRATDNSELKYVKLFYRFKKAGAYTEIQMRNESKSAEYYAKVKTAGITANSIQYYIKAEDTAGNAVLRGYSFAPLNWPLNTPVLSNTIDTKKSPNILFYVLGVVALAGLAGLASQGSSSSGNGNVTVEPTTTCCSLTITTNNP